MAFRITIQAQVSRVSLAIDSRAHFFLDRHFCPGYMFLHRHVVVPKALSDILKDAQPLTHVLDLLLDCFGLVNCKKS